MTVEALFVITLVVEWESVSIPAVLDLAAYLLPLTCYLRDTWHTRVARAARAYLLPMVEPVLRRIEITFSLSFFGTSWVNIMESNILSTISSQKWWALLKEEKS